MTVKHRIIHNPSGYHSRGRNFKEKAYNFALFIKKYDWTGEWNEDPETGDVTVIATRNGERIEAFWNSPIPWPEVWYHYGGSKIKCRNISQAALFAQGKPDPERMRKSSRKMRPKVNGIAPSFVAEAGNPAPSADDLIAEMTTSLPFDKESTPEEIKAVIKQHINPTLLWVNRISGKVESDIIKTWSRHLKVTQTKEGKTIIHFIGMNCFHAVYVDCVIGVS